jgi:hypothetical protein
MSEIAVVCAGQMRTGERRSVSDLYENQLTISFLAMRDHRFGIRHLYLSLWLTKRVKAILFIKVYSILS